MRTNYNLILHVIDGDPRRMDLAFNLALNYRTEVMYRNYNLTPQQIAANAAMGNLQSYEDIKIVIVVNGPAVMNLVTYNTNARLYNEAERISGLGVDILCGQYSMKEHNVTADDMWPFVKIVPVTVTIAELQQQGYSYVRV